jgi:hypothetical protein
MLPGDLQNPTDLLLSRVLFQYYYQILTNNIIMINKMPSKFTDTSFWLGTDEPVSLGKKNKSRIGLEVELVHQARSVRLYCFDIQSQGLSDIGSFQTLSNKTEYL